MGLTDTFNIQIHIHYSQNSSKSCLFMLLNIWQEKWFWIHIKLPHNYNMYPLLRPSVHPLFFWITHKTIITSLWYTHQNKRWHLSLVMMTIDQICRCLIALHLTTTNTMHNKINSRISGFWAHHLFPSVAKHSQVISVWSRSKFLLCLQRKGWRYTPLCMKHEHKNVFSFKCNVSKDVVKRNAQATCLHVGYCRFSIHCRVLLTSFLIDVCAFNMFYCIELVSSSVQIICILQ